MKTRLLILAISLLTSFNSLLFAQCPAAGYTCIPDTAFEAELVAQGIDLDGMVDGRVLTANISGVTTLDITNKGISNLAGIEGFTSLETLIGRFNNLTTVDLSSNTNLTYLDLFENSLTAIDVQANTALTHLDLGSFDKIGKRNQITVIDVDMNTELEFLNLNYNDLNDLDVTLNVKLTGLGCSGNNLTDLVLTNNNLLTSLGCSDNSISSLVLTNNTNLESIGCYGNNMTSLTLPVTNTVTRLDCYNNSLTGTLDVSDFINLELLWCYNNSFSGTLDLSSNTKLENVDCGENALTAITMPDDMDTLFRLVCDNNNISELDLTNNNYLRTLWCNDANIDMLHLPTTPTNTYMDVWCSGNNLTALNVSSLSNLRNLWCYDNDLGEIDVSSNSNLILLDCGINPFTNGLNVASNSNLVELYCNNNNLTSGNLSLNVQLQYLGVYNDAGIYDNTITDLNLESNLDLMWVSCGGNPNITNVTMPSSANLTEFYAFGNGFTDLSFLKPINRANLLGLDVGNGNLTSIDVSDMPELLWFYCNGNSSLSYLDVSNGANINLEIMWADDTSLSCIQVDSKAYADSKDPDDWRKPVLASYEEFCATAGVDDVVQNSILMYPNPVKNKLYLDLKIDATYSLSNVFGQDIQKGALVSGTNELDMQSLFTGLYLLNLETPEGKATKKIIKN